MKKIKLIATIASTLLFIVIAVLGVSYYIQHQQNIDPENSEASEFCEGVDSQCGVQGADPCCAGLECKPVIGSSVMSCQQATASCIPTLSAPSNNRVITSNPTFTWTACTSTNPKYQLKVMNGATEVQTVILTNITSYTFTDITWVNGTTYSWTIKLCPSNDCVGGTPSATSTFTYQTALTCATSCRTAPDNYICTDTRGTQTCRAATVVPALERNGWTCINCDTTIPTITRTNCQGDNSVCNYNEMCKTTVTPNVCTSSVNEVCTLPSTLSMNCVNLSIISRACNIANKPDGTNCGTLGQTCQNGSCQLQASCETEGSQCGVQGADPCCTGLECRPLNGSSLSSCQQMSFARVSVNEIDTTTNYNDVTVAAYQFNTSIKVSDCTRDESINRGPNSKVFKCNNVVQGTKYTYIATATPKTTSNPTITSEISGNAYTSSMYDLWISYAYTIQITPAAPSTGQEVTLNISGKKIGTPAGNLKIAVTGPNSYTKDFTEVLDANVASQSTFTKTYRLTPTNAGTHNIAVSFSVGHALSIPGSILSYKSHTFQVGSPSQTVTPTPAVSASPTPGPTPSSTNCQGNNLVCATNQMCKTTVSPNVCTATASEVCTVATNKSANCILLTIVNRACVSTDKANGTSCGTAGETCQAGLCTNPSTTNYSTVKGINLTVNLGKRKEKANYTYPTAFIGVWRDAGASSKMLAYKVVGLAKNIQYIDATFLSGNGTAEYTLTGEDYLIIKPEGYLSKSYKIKSLTIQSTTTIVKNEPEEFLAGDTIMDTGTFDSVNIRDYVFFRDFFGRDNTYDYYYIDFNGSGSVTILDAVEFRNNLGKSGSTKDLNPLVINAIQTAMEGNLYKVIKY